MQKAKTQSYQNYTNVNELNILIKNQRLSSQDKYKRPNYTVSIRDAL